MLKIKRGFTLIELLVVISIIGILATLMVANYNAARERARDAQRKSDIRNIQTALRIYYNDTQRYPCEDTTGTDPGDIRACDNNAVCASVANCAWNQTWAIGSRTYMSKLPDDPSPNRNYRYDQIDNDNYTLKACLENPSDDKCSATAEAWCNTTLAGCVYVVQP